MLRVAFLVIGLEGRVSHFAGSGRILADRCWLNANCH